MAKWLAAAASTHTKKNPIKYPNLNEVQKTPQKITEIFLKCFTEKLINWFTELIQMTGSNRTLNTNRSLKISASSLITIQFDYFFHTKFLIENEMSYRKKKV